MKKKILFIDMDGVICNFNKASYIAKKTNPAQPFPQAQWGFFLRLEEIPDAINSIKILEEKYDVWILTRPSFPNVNSWTEKAQWIWDHIGYYMVEKIIMSGDKSKVGEVGNFLIDDKNTDKQSEFKGEWIEFGSSKFPNWKTVVDYLMIDYVLKITSTGHNLAKPKKYSRNLFICTHECPVLYKINIICNIIVKYEVEPNKVLSTYKLKKTQWGTYQYWGTFKQIIELPSIFSKLDEEDFMIRTGFFTRDNVQMPFVNGISILNFEKYKMLKNKEDRRKKLNKINLTTKHTNGLNRINT